MKSLLRLATALLFVVSAGACASSAPMADAPPPAPAVPEHVDPSGDWEISVEVGGQAIDGIMEITGSHDEGFYGFVDTPVGAAEVMVEVDGAEVTITVPDAGVTIVAEMDAVEGVMEGGVSGAMGEGGFFASRIDA